MSRENNQTTTFLYQVIDPRDLGQINRDTLLKFNLSSPLKDNELSDKLEPKEIYVDLETTIQKMPLFRYL